MDDGIQENSQSKSQSFSNSSGFFSQSKTFFSVIIALFFLIIGNLIIINAVVFFSKAQSGQSNSLAIQQVAAVCPQSCIGKFSEFVSSSIASQKQTGASNTILPQPTNTPSPTPSPTAIPTPTSTPAPSASPSATPTPVYHEYFIPLGQGSGNYADWTVMPGVEATINPSYYGKIVHAYFEATVRIPAGSQQVWLQLYNANTYQTIVGSSLTLSSGTTTLLTSQDLTLGSSPVDVQVQLKTQLQAMTYVDQARIHIISQ